MPVWLSLAEVGWVWLSTQYSLEELCCFCWCCCCLLSALLLHCCCCSCTSLWLLLAIVAVTASVGVAAVQILVLLLTVAGLFPIHLDSAVPCFQSTFANAVQFQSVLFFSFFFTASMSSFNKLKRCCAPLALRFFLSHGHVMCLPIFQCLASMKVCERERERGWVGECVSVFVFLPHRDTSHLAPILVCALHRQ